MIITLWHIYPDLIHVCFKIFTCVTLQDGSTRLLRDLEIVCYESDHLRSIYIGILIILFYVVGIPTLFFYLLH